MERRHVKDINALHLSEDFQSFQTSGLFEIGGDGSRFGARRKEIFLRLDLCNVHISMIVLVASLGTSGGVRVTHPRK